jgi:hypothetical protein
MELIYLVVSIQTFALLNHQVEKIDSSAEALRVYPSPVLSFPPKINFAITPRK